ncbi:MAG: hypothetical protein Q8R35_03445 [bacterium]|nr:hypothetical protein [bacterium]
MKFLKQLGSILFWRYHRLRASWPVWYFLLNREPRRRWRSFGLSLDERGNAIVQALQDDGIAVLSLADLLPEALLTELVREAARRAERLAGGAFKTERNDARVELKSGIFSASTKKYQKDFLVDVWGEGKAPLLDPENPFLRLALGERVLGIVGAYLGMVPRFHYFSLLSTVILPPDAPAQYSQRWHRDSEDRKMVKAFLYLTDVEESGAGPFTYVKGSQRGGRFGRLFPQHPPVGSYPPPGAVERAVPADAIRTCYGKAGTLIFCDTTGLHRGGYSTTKERIMFTASYVSRASLHPAGYRVPPGMDFPPLSPLVRTALGS